VFSSWNYNLACWYFVLKKTNKRRIQKFNIYWHFFVFVLAIKDISVCFHAYYPYIV